ncbi:sigma factor-like helix-turn-helix DNA-binding protein, partial [Paenibacillus larvae]
LRVLETYSVGNGITVSRLNEDDHLQDLHQKLRGLPSYMYLTPYEQKLETAANAYLVNHPVGTKAQLQAVRNCNPLDEEDAKNLRDLQNKIRKVIKARTGVVDGYEAILEQLAEYQDLKAEKEKIDRVLENLDEHLSNLLRLRFIEGLTVEDVAKQLGISRRTHDRWRKIALEKYTKLSGL